MQKITRRPHGGRIGRKRKTEHKDKERNKRRMSRRASREHQRKLKRKLCHIVEEMRLGHYRGVRNSPLLRANLPYAMKILTQR